MHVFYLALHKSRTIFSLYPMPVTHGHVFCVTLSAPVGGDPLSVINLTTQALVPRRPIMISLPLPPSTNSAATTTADTNTAAVLIPQQHVHAAQAQSQMLQQPQQQQGREAYPVSHDIVSGLPPYVVVPQQQAQLQLAAPGMLGAEPAEPEAEAAPARQAHAPPAPTGLLSAQQPQRPRLSPADLQHEFTQHINK